VFPQPLKCEGYSAVVILNVVRCRTALHKALYWGHIQIAALLLQKQASTYIQDYKACPTSKGKVFVACDVPTRAVCASTLTTPFLPVFSAESEAFDLVVVHPLHSGVPEKVAWVVLEPDLAES
jgi:ankyrin repeat protein